MRINCNTICEGLVSNTVGKHNSNPAYSPGADDNATGTACVLAVAELLRDFDFNYTLVFMAFSGEEQGLYGARLHARARAF